METRGESTTTDVAPEPRRPRPFRWAKSVRIVDTDQVMEFDSSRADVLGWYLTPEDGAVTWLLKGRGLGLQWSQTEFPDGHMEGRLLCQEGAGVHFRLAYPGEEIPLWQFCIRA